MVPHFRGLSREAIGYGLSSHEPGHEWLQVFEEEFTEVIAEILRHRLELLATGRDFEYTWAEACGPYNPAEMGVHGARGMQPERALWTVFPGFKVRLNNSVNLKSYAGMKAKVKPKVPLRR